METLKDIILFTTAIILIIFFFVGLIDGIKEANQSATIRSEMFESQGYSEEYCKKYYASSRLSNVPVACLKYFDQ